MKALGPMLDKNRYETIVSSKSKPRLLYPKKALLSIFFSGYPFYIRVAGEGG